MDRNEEQLSKELDLQQSNELNQDIIKDLQSGISHGILVCNLSYLLARRLGIGEEEAGEIKIAGFIHDVGKLVLSPYLYGRNSNGLSIEEMKYMRMHPKMSYQLLKKYDFSDYVMDIVLRHHECYDGSGYPQHLVGEQIPIGARIIKVVDEFAAMIADRPYRRAFDMDTAVEIMIEEIKNMDMSIFIEFQRLIHEEDTLQIIENSMIELSEQDILDILEIDIDGTSSEIEIEH